MCQVGFKGYDVVMWEPLEETDDYKRIKQEKRMFYQETSLWRGILKRLRWILLKQ